MITGAVLLLTPKMNNAAEKIAVLLLAANWMTQIWGELYGQIPIF